MILETTHSILGQQIKCTLDDGRIVTGTFVCLDRLYVSMSSRIHLKTSLLKRSSLSISFRFISFLLLLNLCLLSSPMFQFFFLFVYRRKNLILTNVVEERHVNKSHYTKNTTTTDDDDNDNKNNIILARRNLSQAMIPGFRLRKVEIDKSILIKNNITIPMTAL